MEKVRASPLLTSSLPFHCFLIRHTSDHLLQRWHQIQSAKTERRPLTASIPRTVTHPRTEATAYEQLAPSIPLENIKLALRKLGALYLPPGASENIVRTPPPKKLPPSFVNQFLEPTPAYQWECEQIDGNTPKRIPLSFT